MSARVLSALSRWPEEEKVMHGSIESAFIGRVGTEPELKTSAAGKPWLRFSAAVGKEDATQWVQVACFGERAESLAATLRKGDRVYVEGSIKLNTWTGKDGEPRSGLSVAAWKAEKLGEIGRNRPAKPSAARQRADDDDPRRDWQAPAERQNGAAHPPAAPFPPPARGGRFDDAIPFAPEVR